MHITSLSYQFQLWGNLRKIKKCTHILCPASPESLYPCFDCSEHTEVSLLELLELSKIYVWPGCLGSQSQIFVPWDLPAWGFSSFRSLHFWAKRIEVCAFRNSQSFAFLLLLLLPSVELFLLLLLIFFMWSIFFDSSFVLFLFIFVSKVFEVSL